MRVPLFTRVYAVCVCMPVLTGMHVYVQRVHVSTYPRVCIMCMCAHTCVCVCVVYACMDIHARECGCVVVSMPCQGLRRGCWFPGQLQPTHPRSFWGLSLSLESVSPVLAKKGKQGVLVGLLSSVLPVVHLNLCHLGF